MTDKEKFRTEIVRLAQLHLDMREAYKDNGYISAAAIENVLYGHDLSILSFIDSMQEEPTIPDIVDEHFDEMLGEEPVSEDLEKAAEEYAKSKHTNLALIDIVSLDFKAGAQWKKQQMMDKILFWLNNNVRDWIDMPYDQNAFIRQLENIMND